MSAEDDTTYLGVAATVLLGHHQQTSFFQALPGPRGFAFTWNTPGASLVAQAVKSLPSVQETWV